MLLPIVLQVIAFIVLMAEIMIPSFGILTVISLGILGYSWHLILENPSQTVTLAFGIADLIAFPLSLYFGFKIFKKSPLALNKKLKVGSGLEEKIKVYENLIGKHGEVETQLKPTGKVVIDGEIYEVTSEGDVIDRGKRVQVLSTSGVKIIVNEIE